MSCSIRSTVRFSCVRSRSTKAVKSAVSCGFIPAVEDHGARRRLVDARQHVEEGRLAGAVRADQADDRAARNEEVDVVDGDEAAELLPELLRLEQVAVRARL